MKIGVSCGSNDLSLIPFLSALINNRELDYVELYVLPTVKVSELVTWSKSKIVEVVHIPHDNRGCTPEEYFEIGNAASSIINPKIQVYDAGTESMGNYLPSRWSGFGDVCAENMPHITSLGDKSRLSTPSSVEKQISNGHWCLDFTHAWVSANILGEDPEKFIVEFLEHKPKHLHLSGTSHTTSDDHCPLRDSVYHFNHWDEVWLTLVHELDSDIRLTIETGHEVPDREKAILDDINYFRENYVRTKEGGLGDNPSQTDLNPISQ